jgi:hypothetical protein
LDTAADRPDLVVVDKRRARVVGIVEVKFHEGDTPANRFREAVSQLVRYARGYAVPTDELLRSSFVAMNAWAPIQFVDGPGIPAAFSFPDLMQSRLREWVRDRWLS